MEPSIWVHKKNITVKMLSAYAVLTLPVGHSPALQELQQILLNKGLDSVTPSDAHVLLSVFFFYVELGCLSVEQVPALLLPTIFYIPPLLIYIICQASGGIWVCDPGV